jgi:hypothetical protein
MGFDALIEKVRQAETALEAQERRVGADWRQLRGSWRSLWTPGRIVLAGLATGFMVGRAEPFKRAAGGGVLQLLTALSGMFAGGSAQAAASEAGDAADAAQEAKQAHTGDGDADTGADRDAAVAAWPMRRMRRIPRWRAPRRRRRPMPPASARGCRLAVAGLSAAG